MNYTLNTLAMANKCLSKGHDLLSNISSGSNGDSDDFNKTKKDST
jgi:hypothetical protein